MAKIDDIMKMTGFSRTAVSKALNDKSDISEATKKIIRDAAKKLNYIPNINARNLRAKQQNIIALIISSPSKESEKTNTLYSLLMGVNSALIDQDYELALYIIDSKDQTKKSYVEFCKERNVKGAILVGIKTDDHYIKQLKTSEIPYVLIDVDIQDTNHMNVVKIDDTKAAFDATEHLIKHQHKHIAFMNGSETATVAINRLKGYKQALAFYNIKILNEYIQVADFSEEIARTKSIALLHKYPEITAIFAASDLMALGVMQACEHLGLSIPQDLSLIGFDDIPIAAYVKPSLTTIGQSFFDKGKISVELISSQLETKNDKKIVTLPHTLMVRESVKTLR